MTPLSNYVKSTLSCSCRKNRASPLDGKGWAENILYKCIALVEGYPDKVYVGTPEGDFKHRFYNHRISFNNEDHSTDTTLSKYVVGIKKKFKIKPLLNEMAHNQICANLSKHFQEMSIKSRKISNS